MRFELTDLRVFVAIAEAKSVTAGANEVHLTAPSASYRLKNLEQAMGVPLFRRTQKGMTLTPAGDTVLRYARSILGNVQSLQSAMTRHTERVEGHVRLFAHAGSLSRLSAVLARYLVAYPNVSVDLEERLSDDIVKAVRDGFADIGLVAGPLQIDDLEAISYGHDALVVVIPPRHPLGLHKRIPLQTALDHDWVGNGRKNMIYLYLEQMAARLGITPRVRVHVHGSAAVLQCVQEGVGVALLHRSFVQPAVEQGLVETVELDEAWAPRELRVVVRSLEELAPFARDLVNYIARPVEDEA